ncbi:tripartite tricarboxylate transporter substrate binding protein [Xylophilus rhododendri]|uniref:Tripartite tricarboxylate transporter substrate binding protein n=2 Tax=Xylophilus rhododendri TaxID=2697032 RepID=A0A857JCY6_9BURK|nr:tripartite tricarboxylate transporter substrate binding protein [Xylophilus rhododendri]QHJ01498.1 tripartite tricarboxylate transporter substrate binding protein [Xylophilus rhododendri]
MALPAAAAEPYPSRPITLIVPFAAGGGTDTIARDLAKTLGEKLGVGVVVDNRGGGGGIIGAQSVAKATADGYTLLFATSTFVTNAVTSATPYKVDQDFTPIAMLGRGPLMVVASKELGVHDVAGLMDAARKRPAGLDFCSAGPGSINHLAGELFKQKTQLNLTHVPYKGSGPATLDLLADRVQLFFATVPTILPYVKEDKVSLLAVTGATRSPLYPQVPTMIESGVKGFDITTWWGVLAPPRMPAALVAQLNQAINQAAAKGAVKDRLSSEGAETYSGSAEDFRKVLGTELSNWRAVVKNANLKLQ